MDKWRRCAIHLRNCIHPIMLLLSKTRVKYQIIFGEIVDLLPNRPTIFAVNHSNCFDAPVSATAISRAYGRRCDILAGKQPMWLTDRLFLSLNGVIWIDRKSKPEMIRIKEKLIAHLKQGSTIMWYPEGTWNLTDNLLMLPMKWGIIEVAAKAGAQIVPVVLEYDREKMTCHVGFGSPIMPNEKTDKAESIQQLRDRMATIRYEQWETRGLLRRGEINTEALREELLSAIKEYPPIDWNYEQTVIFHPQASPEVAFAHLHTLIPSRENAFLFNKRYAKICD